MKTNHVTTIGIRETLHRKQRRVLNHVGSRRRYTIVAGAVAVEVGVLTRKSRSRRGEYLRDLYRRLRPLVAFRRVLYKFNNFSVRPIDSSTEADAKSLHLLRHGPLLSTRTGSSL